MNKITTTVLLLISALAVVAVGFYARSLYTYLHDIGEVVNTPETHLPQPIKETPPTTVKEVSYQTASWLDYHLPEAPDYSKNYDTCASRDYPRGTRLMVATQAGKSVVCRVNDYGPEEWTGVQLDLSSHAFAQLAPLSQGLVEVTIEEV